jgi:hypothetical protein
VANAGRNQGRGCDILGDIAGLRKSAVRSICACGERTVDTRQHSIFSAHYHRMVSAQITWRKRMTKAVAEPHVAEEGVAFTVEVGFVDRECLISRNALVHLQRIKGGPLLDLMEIYRASEEQIHGVARRLVVAGVSGSPLVLGAAYFV